jgi:hypothetical protein
MERSRKPEAMNETNLDILISRVVDGVATPADWVSLESIAASNPSVWREIAVAQRTDRALVAAVCHETLAAERIDLHTQDNPGGSLLFSQSTFTRRLRIAGAWGGWAAAAAVAMAFLGHAGAPAAAGRGAPVVGSVDTAQASLPGPISSAGMFLDEYLSRGREEGTVISELPDKIVVETTQSADGQGYEVVYLRQIMERVRVQDLYRFSQDEAGNPTPVKINPFVRGGPPM